MKKTSLYAAMFAFSLPMSSFGLGLGEMKVKSALDQPFLAEIELIDIGSASLSTIKVGIADPENFERVGLERVAILSLLSFKIARNDQGKFVIVIESQERMSEPYMEMIIDMAWPKGQLYKAYTVLLDPPGYQLQSATQQRYTSHKTRVTHYSEDAGVVHKTIISSTDHNPVGMNDGKSQTTYGPTIINENVWQIAQHYKTSEVSLPQVVLAIVGANPDFFTDGNLNGLKIGVKLIIPATTDIQTVPADLATQEVMAHDSAWNEKKEINHIISPPYMQLQTNQAELMKNFELPPVPRLSSSTGPSIATLAKLIQINSAVQIDNKDQPNPVKNINTSDREATTKAELSITTAAVETMRESNALLMDQFKMVQEQNKKLQQQLDKRDKEMAAIRAQLQALMKERTAIASQVSSSQPSSDSSIMPPLFLMLLVAAGGGGFALWHFNRRKKEGSIFPKYNETLIEQKKTFPELQSDVENTDVVIPEQKISDEKIDLNELSSQPQENSLVEETKSTKNKPGRKKKDTPVITESLVEQEVKNDVTDDNQNIDVITATAPAIIQEEITEPESKMEVVESVEENSNTDDEGAPLKFEHMNESTPIETTEIVAPIVEEQSQVAEDAPLEFESTLEEEPSQEIEKHKMVVEPATEESKLESEQESETKSEEEESNGMLEFESGLHNNIVEEIKEPQKEVGTESTETEEENDGIDFISDLSVDSIAKNDVQEENRINENKIDADLNDLDSTLTGFFDAPENEITVEIENDSIAEEKKESKEDNVFEFDNVIDSSTSANPLKSTKALDTLLSLAKTYIGMDDFESARTSLEEVMEHGSESQKVEAKQLMDDLRGR